MNPCVATRTGRAPIGISRSGELSEERAPAPPRPGRVTPCPPHYRPKSLPPPHGITRRGGLRSGSNGNCTPPAHRQSHSETARHRDPLPSPSLTRPDSACLPSLGAQGVDDTEALAARFGVVRATVR